MPCRTLFLVIAAAILLAPAWAQNQAVPAQAEQPVKIEAGTQEVVLDIVVRDKKGRLIRDLKPEEIEVQEDGVPQKLRAFRLVEGQEETNKVEAAVKEQTGPKELDPLKNLRLITVVFDNTLDVDGKRFLRQTTQDLLKMANEPNLFFSLYAIDQNLHVLQPFTTNYELMKREVEKAQTSGFIQFSQRSAQMINELQQQAARLAAFSADRTSTGAPRNPQGFAQAKMAKMQLDMLQFSQSLERGYNERMVLYGLLALVREQAQLPGRKMLVFLSNWFTVDEPQVDLFRTVISAANRGNVAIYTVDSKGLVTWSQNDGGRQTLASAAQSSEDQLRSASGPVQQDQVQVFDNIQRGLRSNPLTHLRELSQETGGIMIAETNDVKAPLRKSLEELRTYYEAAYTPQVTTYDGKFRKLTVRVSRPDVIVHARGGYYALPPGKGNQTLLAYEMPLLQALGEAPPRHDIDFRTGALRFNPRGNQVQYTMAIDVPMRGIEFQPDSEKKTARTHASILAVIKDEKGEIVKKFSQDFPRQVPADKVEAFKNGSLIQTFRAALVPGKYSVEVAVSDRGANKIGVKRTDFVVPEAGAGLAVSSVCLIRRVDPAPAQIDPEDPFIAKEGKIVPEYSNMGQSGPGKQLAFYMTVYPAAGNPASTSLNMSIYQAGQLLGGGDLPLPTPDKDGRIQYIASIPADNFPAGEYEMRVTAKQGSQTSQDKLVFKVQ